jgi:hypothetical protein
MDPQNQPSSEPHSDPPIDPKISKPTGKSKLIWGAILAGIIAVSGIVYGAYSIGQKMAPTPSGTPTTTNIKAPIPTSTPFVFPSPNSTATVTDSNGITWYEDVQPLKDVKLFNYVKGGDVYDVIYFKVGQDNGMDIILSLVQWNSPDYPSEAMFLKKSESQYEFLVKHSPDFYKMYGKEGRYGGPELASSVTENKDKTYASLAELPTITVSGQTLKLGSGYNLFAEFQNYGNVFFPGNAPDSVVKMEEVGTTPNGKIYSHIATSKEGGHIQSQYVLKRYNGTARAYQLYPSFYKDDTVPAITWSDGKKNKDTYRIDGTQGCGYRTALAIAPESAMNDLKAAGKTNTGETVYEFKDANNALFKSYFKGVVGDGDTYTDYSNKEIPLTTEEYLAKHGIFIYKDKLNRLLLFVNTVVAAAAECGKPVVYLYPTQKTDVSVRVDAKITVSEPEYGNGWNVTASPDGKLVNKKDGKAYDSLFWEGTGHEYPSITQGFVVPSATIESTLRDHLAKLGLNQKESADFMEFWLPKMPKTPYVRLTWFGTKQMDRLAPLAINPKPDSVIRIFLDFEGLQKPFSFPEQRLSAIPRKGFTVVEWGGLLRK